MLLTWRRSGALGWLAMCGALLIAGCAHPVLMSTPQARSEARRAECPGRCDLRLAIRSYPGRELKLRMRDGRSERLRSPVIEGDSVFGEWRTSPEGGTPRRVSFAVVEVVSAEPAQPVRSVRQENAREVGKGMMQGAVAGVLIGAGLVVAFVLGLWP